MLGIGDAARHELTASWRGKLGDDPASATIVAAGPLQALTVELDVDGPLTAQIGGSVRPLEARPGVTLSGRVQAPQTGAAVTFGDIDLGVDGDLAALIVNVSTQAGVPRSASKRRMMQARRRALTGAPFRSRRTCRPLPATVDLRSPASASR